MSRVYLVRVAQLCIAEADAPTEAITSADLAVPVIAPHCVDRDREVFVALHLDARMRPISVEVLSIGTNANALVHPREVYKAAVLNNAHGIIVAHNHPSGLVEPSADDRAITQRLWEAGEILGIELLDHIILAAVDPDTAPIYFSFRDEGKPPFPPPNGGKR